MEPWLVPQHKRNMWTNAPDDALALRRERRCIETVFRQIAAMGIASSDVRSVAG